MAATAIATSETFFDTVPREVLLLIAALIPNLQTLDSFSQSWSAAAQLIDECGAQIIENVMSRSAPPQIQTIVRIITQKTRSPSSLSLSMEDCIKLSKDPNATYEPISAITSSKVLRNILLSADWAHHLSRICL